METKKWFISHLKEIVIAVVITLAISMVAYYILSQQKQMYKTELSVLSDRAEHLQFDIEYKQAQIEGHKAINDSLFVRINEKIQELKNNKIQLAKINYKYELERSKIKLLNSVQQVDLFLSNTEQNDYPVMSFQDSTEYIIPIESIEIANIVFTNFDEQVEVNNNLRVESNIKSLQIKDFIEIVKSKDLELKDYKDIVELYNYKLAIKEEQLIASEKKYKAEHRKLLVVKIVSGVAIIAEAIVIVFVATK